MLIQDVQSFMKKFQKILRRIKHLKALKNPQTFKIYVSILLEKLQPIQVRRTMELHLKQEEKVQNLLRFFQILKKYCISQQRF